MSQSMRIDVVVALAVGAFIAASAGAAERTGVDGLKLGMVKSVVDGYDAADASAMHAAVQRANAMTGIHVDSTTAQPSVTLKTDKPCLFEASLSADGGLLTVDVANAIPVPDLEKMVLDGGRIIAGVTARLAQADPVFVTRVEIALSSPATFATVGRGHEILIAFAPRGVTPSLTELSRDVLAELDRQRLSGEIACLAFAESLARFKGRMAGLGIELPAADSDGTPGVDELQRQLEILVHPELASASSMRNVGPLADFAKQSSEMKSQLDASLASIQKKARLHEEMIGGFKASNDPSAMTPLGRLADDVRAKGEADRAAFREMQSRFDSLAERTVQSAGYVHGQTEDRIAQLESALSAMQLGTPKAESPGSLARLNLELTAFRQEETTAKLATIDPVAVFVPQTDTGSSAPPPKRANESSSTEASRHAGQRLFSVNAGSAERSTDNGIIVLAQDPAEPTEAETVAAPAPDADAAGEKTAADAGADAPSTTEVLQQLTVMAPPKSEPSVLYNKNMSPEEDPLRQIVDLNFVDMPLKTVVEILAMKGQINVLASDLGGNINSNLQGIPLGRAIEIILRQENLGIIEEDGVYRITSYEEAVASRRETILVPMTKASAMEIKETFDQVISGSGSVGGLSIAANESTNMIILSGPRELVLEYAENIRQLDVADERIPTKTIPIKLNYSEVEEILGIVQELLSDVGKVSGDSRGRQLILTDLPVKVTEIEDIVKQLDLPVKQVSIEAMIVDALMADDAETGIDWITRAVRRTNRNGVPVGNLQGLSGIGDFSTGAVTPAIVPALNLGGQIAFQVLSGNIDISAVIGGEVRSENAELIANPSLVTVENKLASIIIAQEIPYQELQNTGLGQPVASTEFKDVGTTLQVTPRVTHDNHVLVALYAKQSDTKGESVTGVPPEDKREVTTELRVADGQTIYIGGLRRFDDELSHRKTPILGDLPILGLLFKNQSVVKEHLELLVFLTCHVLPDDMPDITPSQKRRYDELGGLGNEDVDATKSIVQDYIHPETDPIYKWKRPK